MNKRRSGNTAWWRS